MMKKLRHSYVTKRPMLRREQTQAVWLQMLCSQSPVHPVLVLRDRKRGRIPQLLGGPEVDGIGDLLDTGSVEEGAIPRTPAFRLGQPGP